MLSVPSGELSLTILYVAGVRVAGGGRCVCGLGPGVGGGGGGT